MTPTPEASVTWAQRLPGGWSASCSIPSAPNPWPTTYADSARCPRWERHSWVEYYRLTASDWPDFRAAVRAALSDGPLTVAELGEVLTKRRLYQHLKPIFDEGAGTLVKPLTWQGDMSLGPPRDGQLTGQRLDANPRWGGIPDVDDAGPRAIVAYLRTYGPATPDHVHYWLGNGLSAGRSRLARWCSELGDRLVAVDVEGTTAYVAAEDVDGLTAARPSDAARFLPGHDQWVMGPGTKDVQVTPSSQRGPVTRKANPVPAPETDLVTSPLREDQAKTPLWTPP